MGRNVVWVTAMQVSKKAHMNVDAGHHACKQTVTSAANAITVYHWFWYVGYTSDAPVILRRTAGKLMGATVV